MKKQEEIYRLRKQVKRLQAQLHRQERQITEGYFGSATPSSKKPIKINSDNNKDMNLGGAKKGHPGKGRRCLSAAQADGVE